MDIQHLIGLAINGSMFLIVFALGLQANWSEATYLFRRPGLFARSLVAMNLVMAVVAILICLVFDPAPAIKVSLVALSLSPVPPILPGRQEQAGGSASYVIGLLAGASIASIIIVPLGMTIVGAIIGIPLHLHAINIASVVFVSVLLPLLAGIAIHTVAPALALRVAKPLSILAAILLVVAVIPVLIYAFPTLWSLVGNGLLIGLLCFTIIGLLVGHWLGGPNPDDRTVLALAASSRHPGVAIAVANLAFPNVDSVLVIVLAHLLLSAIIATPYVRWRTKEHAATHSEAT